MAVAAMASLSPSLRSSSVTLQSSFTPRISASQSRLITVRAPKSHGLGVVCVQQKTKEPDKKRTGVIWGCDPQSLENGTLLQDWLKAEGLAKQKLVLDRVDSGERGLVTTQSLRQGERLLFIPLSLIITADSGLADVIVRGLGERGRDYNQQIVPNDWGCPEAGKVLKEEGVPEWPRLAVFLISEANLGRSSHWFPYIATLPKSPTSILQWTEAEVNTWLAASPVRERALESIRDVTETYRDLQATVFAKHPEVFPSQVFTLEAFKWAFGILFSRLARMPSLGKLALVPWGDMLNHSPQATAFLDFDKSNAKAVVFVTDRAYESGEQVFISYGKRSSGELLLAYGFISSEYNPHDFVELELALDQEDPSYETKLAAVQEQGLSSPQRFPVRKDGMPAQLLAYARLTVSRDSDTTRLSQMALAATEGGASARVSASLEATLSEEHERNAYERMLAVCENSIVDYSKFLEANEEESLKVRQAGNNARVSRNQMLREFAVALCQNERRILYRLQHILRTDLRGLRSTIPSEGNPVGASGKAKRANAGLFGLFKWNIDLLEK